MARTDIDLGPVTRITADAIGQPGQRVFYVQGTTDEETITLIVEKIQIQTLALGLEQFLDDLKKDHSDLGETPADYVDDEMHIVPPVDPLFRVGELALGYDPERDLMVLMANEVVMEGQNPDEAGVVRFWATRAQMRAMTHFGVAVANMGRQICPQCGQPMDPAGHFCPKKNGHKH